MTDSNEAGMRLLDTDDPDAGILAYVVEGKISKEQADAVWERFDKAAAEGSKVRIFAEMTEWPGFDLEVVKDKLSHIGNIMSTTERMAIVGDARWMGIYAKIVDPITKPEIKHFTTDQRDDALAWLKS